MKIEEQKNRMFILMSILLMIVVLAGGFYFCYKAFFGKSKEPIVNKNKPVTKETGNYNTRLIKEINKSENNNYLISPYSIEIALSMLRDGADNNTKKQLDDLIGNREINYFNSDKKINVANGVFIRDSYKENILDSYYNTVKNKYKSDIIYDKFESPDVVNNWVKKETYDMIPKLLDKLNPDDEVVLVNALAIDVEWKNTFKCDSTNKEEFTKDDGSKYDVAMMHQSYKSDAKYFEIDKAKGVILPYKEYDDNGNKLEFIGILPDGSVKDYVNNLSEDILDSVDDNAEKISSENELSLSIPSFKYSYTVKDMVSNLNNLGIKDVFNKKKADLSNLSSKKLFASDVIHKTDISFKEKGTKAAAATAIIMTDATAKPTKINIIKFDKPFVYIIRDQKSKEMLFFGVMYEPNKYEGSTCEK